MYFLIEHEQRRALVHQRLQALKLPTLRSKEREYLPPWIYKRVCVANPAWQCLAFDYKNLNLRFVKSAKAKARGN